MKVREQWANMALSIGIMSAVSSIFIITAMEAKEANRRISGIGTMNQRDYEVSLTGIPEVRSG